MSIQKLSSLTPAGYAPDAHIEPEFVCSCEEWMRTACAGEGFFREHGGQRYCVLHYPGKNKTADFNVAMQKKLETKDFNFRGVWFPDEVDFAGFQFSKAANFSKANFSETADFSDAGFNEAADFSDANFSKAANFSEANFSEVGNFSKANFSADANFDNAVFSANANFRAATFSAAANFGYAKFKTADFRNVVFTDARFGYADFCNKAYFTYAKFSAVANFFFGTFSADVDFNSVIFSKNADFRFRTFFGAASFGHTTFNADADFTGANLRANADFIHSTFAAYVRFAGDNGYPVFGDQSALNLEHCRIEKPERVSFHTLTLRPHWFVNVDPRKFEFVNVEWPQLPMLTSEIESLRDRNVSSLHRLLSIAYRQLAVNAEENHRYGEAAEFRYGSMDLRRLEWSRGRKRWIWPIRQWNLLKKSTRRLYRSLQHDWGIHGRTWQRSWRFLKTYWRSLQILHWLYWAASGYGERATRAVVVLVTLWFLFACAYCVTGFERKPVASATATTATRDEVGQPLPITKALTYSLGVMSLQKPEPRPVTTAAQTLVTLETILGPVQAALLALAIRRKFMR